MTRATPERDPFQHARTVGRQLSAWALGSMSVGVVLVALTSVGVLSGDAGQIALGFALQSLIWGAIDGVIAWFGARDLRRRLAAGEADDALASAAFGRRLRRLLLLNAALDVAYVAAGVAILMLWRTPDGLGHGLGVLVQGGFLLLFDTVHARRCGDASPAPAGPSR